MKSKYLFMGCLCLSITLTSILSVTVTATSPTTGTDPSCAQQCQTEADTEYQNCMSRVHDAAYCAQDKIDTLTQCMQKCPAVQ